MKAFSLLLSGLLVASGLSAQVGRYDVIGEARDANGFLLNPHWRHTANPLKLDPAKECGILALAGTPGFRGILLKDRDCFAEVRNLLSLNEARALRVVGGGCQQAAEDGTIQGHLNFFPVTMTGVLHYNATGALLTQLVGGDFDHTFELTPDSQRPMPVTKWNIDTRSESLSTRLSPDTASIHVELDIRESTMRVENSWRPANLWWKQLKRLGDVGPFGSKAAGSWPVGNELMGLGLATITGIFNLDMVHGGHAEIHPVLGMALLRRRTRRPDGAAMTDEWVVLARDRGNEGNCASGILPLNLGPSPRLGDVTARTIDTFRLRLRPPFGAIGRPVLGGPGVSWLAQTRQVRGVEFWWKEGEGLDLAAFWPRPEPGAPDAMVLGTLTVTWPGQFGPLVEVAKTKDSRVFPPRRRHDEPKRKTSPHDPEVEYYRNLKTLNPLLESEAWDPTVRDFPASWMPWTGLAPTPIYHHEPNIASCDEVPKSTNPRCVGQWKVAPGFAIRPGGRFGRNVLFSARAMTPPGAVGNLHPSLAVEFRRDARDSTEATWYWELQARSTLPQIGSILRFPGLYGIVQVGGGRVFRHGGPWFFAPAVGLGVAAPAALRVKIAAEFERRQIIGSLRGLPAGYFTIGLTVPVVVR